jgi:hypothetical protein
MTIYANDAYTYDSYTYDTHLSTPYSATNFKFIIVECMPSKADNDGLNTISLIRKMGFKGRIIATTHDEDDIMGLLVNPTTADCFVRYPISVREITKMLAEDGVAEVHR